MSAQQNREHFCKGQLLIPRIYTRLPNTRYAFWNVGHGAFTETKIWIYFPSIFRCCQQDRYAAQLSALRQSRTPLSKPAGAGGRPPYASCLSTSPATPTLLRVQEQRGDSTRNASFKPSLYQGSNLTVTVEETPFYFASLGEVHVKINTQSQERCPGQFIWDLLVSR